MKSLALAAGLALAAAGSASAQSGEPSDPQIAFIAMGASDIDIAAAEQALTKSQNPSVRAFAEQMVRDHTAVSRQAAALAAKLEVTPIASPASDALMKQAKAKRDELAALNGGAFDRAYAANELAFHRTVNTALKDTLIPSADDAELRSLLESRLTLFEEHEAHAEKLVQTVR